MVRKHSPSQTAYAASQSCRTMIPCSVAAAAFDEATGTAGGTGL